MPQHIELNPVSHLTVGTIGEPGNRTFYLQGSKGADSVSVVIEKFQAVTLADSFESLLNKLRREHPEVDAALGATASFDLRLREPLEALFRVGNMGLGYNEESNRIVVVAYELVDEDEEEQPSAVSYWTGPEHISALIDHTRNIVKSGRPICGNCGQPIDPEGHWCAQRNGHKK
jgi:uncharacterized repeat protein (TIGR03847 family)